MDATTGAPVYQGTLTSAHGCRLYLSPTPYQKVYEADFTSFNTPGQYRLVVPGMGASLPFLIDDGIAMDFARAYALGLYHQRCGTNTAMPYTRFTHDTCHAAPASVPLPASVYSIHLEHDRRLRCGASIPTTRSQTAPAHQRSRRPALPLRQQGTSISPAATTTPATTANTPSTAPA